MVVLIKKKRNSVKDKRYIKIQGKYTKRFLHSKKKPGQQIYMQRGGMSDDNAQRLATIAGIMVMFAPFCVEPVRTELLRLIQSFGMSETAADEFYAVVDYCTNLKDISVDILPYVPAALQHTASGFARFTLATATFIAKHYWNYKSLITRFQAIKSGFSAIFGMSCKPLMDFAQDQVSGVKAAVEFAKYMGMLVSQGVKFTTETSKNILKKIYKNVLKPIIVYYLSAAGNAGGESIKAADMYASQIWGNVEYFKELIKAADTSKPVQNCKYIHDSLIKVAKISGNNIVTFTSVNGVKMGRFLKNLPKELLDFISEKAYYSPDEARFQEIALDDAIQKVENKAKKDKLIRDKEEATVAEASAVNYLLKTGIINEFGVLNIDLDALDLSKVVAVSQGTGEIAQDMLIHSFDIDDGPTPTIVSETVLDVAATAAAAGIEVEEVIATATKLDKEAVEEVREEQNEFDSNLSSSNNMNKVIDVFNKLPRRSHTDSKKFIEGLKDEIKNLQMIHVGRYFATPSSHKAEFIESQPEFRISPSPEPEEPKPRTYSAAVRSSSPPSASKSKSKNPSASKKASASQLRLFKILGNKKPSLSTVAEEGPTTGGGTRKRMRYGKRKTQRRQRQRRRH